MQTFYYFCSKIYATMANIFGDKWTFTSFGESHGAAIGGVLDGVPAGLHIDLDIIREELERRAGRKQTGGVAYASKEQLGVSARALREPDEVEWLSGVMESDEVTKYKGQRELITLGTPIAFIIRNKDARRRTTNGSNIRIAPDTQIRLTSRNTASGTGEEEAELRRGRRQDALLPDV